MWRGADDADAIRDALLRQAFGPVRWVEVVQALRARGLSHVVECGPGKVLAGMVKRIDPEAVVLALSRPGLAGRTQGRCWHESKAAQVALVTGASRGIGRAIAATLAAQGFRVVGTATSEAGAAAITQALADWPGCRGAVLDVNDAAAGDALVEAVIKEHGALHVLVNNAGITRDNLAMRMKDDDWAAVLDTNLAPSSASAAR